MLHNKALRLSRAGVGLIIDSSDIKPGDRSLTDLEAFRQKQ